MTRSAARLHMEWPCYSVNCCVTTLWQNLGFKSKLGKFFTLNVLTTRQKTIDSKQHLSKLWSNTGENQCELYKCENKDTNMIPTKKIETEEKSWGSKSKTQEVRQTQWWHRSRNFAALHVGDYTLHIQCFPICMSPQLHIQTHLLSG